ncbi:MAG: alpha/beta hydrolase [Bacteroidales bacterium]|nr:alpha/beta hydrolase [Bacteroidales bacterium]
MKILTTILLILINITNLFSQEKVLLWGKKPDDYRKKKVELFYFPSQKNYHNSALIICPGGSYCYLATQNEGFIPAQKFNEYGFDCFVLRYRRGMKGNRYPSQIQDLQMAIHYIKSNYSQFNTDTSILGVCGFSAGGHLSGTSAIYFNRDFNNIFDGNMKNKNYFRPDFAIMIYPVITMQKDIVHHKSKRNLLGQNYTQSQKDSMSLEQNIHSTMSPIFMINCEDDPIVKYQNSIRMNDSLNAKNIEHYYKLYKIGGHGFGVSENRIKSNDKSASQWYKDFINWINNTFKLNYKL